MTREELTKRAEALVRKQWTDYNDDPCPDIRPETLFADHLHLTGAGQVQLGTAMAAALISTVTPAVPVVEHDLEVRGWALSLP